MENKIVKDATFYRLQRYKTSNVYGGGFSLHTGCFNPVRTRYRPSRPKCHCGYPASSKRCLSGETIYRCCRYDLYDGLEEFLDELNICYDEKCDFILPDNDYIPSEKLEQCDIQKHIHIHKRLLGPK